MNFNILQMNQSNTKAVAEIEKVCFSKPWSLTSIENELNNNCGHFYVAECNGTVVGYCGMHIAVDECYVANIAVLPQYRDNGIGKQLTSHLIEKAKKEHCAFISLEVRPSNIVAVELYKKLGFETVGRRKNFYSSPTEDGLIMTLFFNKI